MTKSIRKSEKKRNSTVKESSIAGKSKSVAVNNKKNKVNNEARGREELELKHAPQDGVFGESHGEDGGCKPMTRTSGQYKRRRKCMDVETTLEDKKKPALDESDEKDTEENTTSGKEDLAFNEKDGEEVDKGVKPMGENLRKSRRRRNSQVAEAILEEKQETLVDDNGEENTVDNETCGKEDLALKKEIVDTHKDDGEEEDRILKKLTKITSNFSRRRKAKPVETILKERQKPAWYESCEKVAVKHMTNEKEEFVLTQAPQHGVFGDTHTDDEEHNDGGVIPMTETIRISKKGRKSKGTKTILEEKRKSTLFESGENDTVENVTVITVENDDLELKHTLVGTHKEGREQGDGGIKPTTNIICTFKTKQKSNDKKSLKMEKRKPTLDDSETWIEEELAIKQALQDGVFQEVDGEHDNGRVKEIESNRGNTIQNLTIIASTLMKEQTSMPWTETFDIISSKRNDDIPSLVGDDLAREVSFYNTTVEAIDEGRRKCDEVGILYTRPADFYAEMVKSDAHMAKVKDSLIFEKKKMEAFEKRKMAREQKFRARDRAKEVHHHVLKDRTSNKGSWKDNNNQTMQEYRNHGGTLNKKRIIHDKKYGFGGKRGRFKKKNV